MIISLFFSCDCLVLVLIVLQSGKLELRIQ